VVGATSFATLFGSCVFAPLLFAVALAGSVFGGVVVTVDPSDVKNEISPNIYGSAWRT